MSAKVDLKVSQDWRSPLATNRALYFFIDPSGLCRISKTNCEGISLFLSMLVGIASFENVIKDWISFFKASCHLSGCTVKSIALIDLGIMFLFICGLKVLIALMNLVC